jgi:hypothetical protein
VPSDGKQPSFPLRLASEPTQRLENKFFVDFNSFSCHVIDIKFKQFHRLFVENIGQG